MARAQGYEPDTALTREEYLAWVAREPNGRYERIDGIVVAMAPERVSHIRVKHAACNALQRSLRNAGLMSCEAVADGLSVRVGDSDFEPDALLRFGLRLPGDATFAPDPMILVEVLSPDSGTRDRVRPALPDRLAR